MNQQRSRRFRSAKEAKQKDEDKAELYKMLRAKGEEPEDGEDEAPKKTWDSNAITPGTPFMDLLAKSLRYWTSYKLSTDPAWENLKIIISDATVPGEGEHKIMNFVRSQRSMPTHDPNMRHVIYGLDADLIMLGLATHEPHFRVIREDVFAQDSKPGVCRICNQPGHLAAECRGEPAKKVGQFGEKQDAPALKPFIWLHVGVLREYLAVEMTVPNQPFRFDLERALDDWVFMCFFVGNDFLPHLPSLDIREEGIDTLIAIWRDNIPTMGGYLTKDGHVDLERAQLILQGLAKQEDAIFRRRKEVEERKDAAAKRRKMNDRRHRPSEGDSIPQLDSPAANRSSGPKRRGEAAPDFNALKTFAPSAAQTANDPRYMTHDMVVNKANVANKSAAAIMKEKMKQKSTVQEEQKNAVEQLMSTIQEPESPASALGKRKAEMMEDGSSTPGRSTPDPAASPAARKDPDDPPEDTVRLWDEGYGDRYYEQKFKVSPSDLEFRHQVGRDYVTGLAWVLLYYFQGCPSWTWYYPHHYAPFAADFVDIDQMEITFDKGKPFRPYEQLMGVMPAQSNHTIPSVFHPLMTDQDSDIVSFYPEDFDIDLNGKKFEWQGVALLPFIDEKRLLDAMATKYPLLTEDEKARNQFGKEVLIFSTKHPLYGDVAISFYSKKAGAPKMSIPPSKSGGLTGKVEKNEDYLPSSALIFPLPAGGMPDLDEDQSISVNYTMPPHTHVHKSMLLPGLKLNPPVLDFADIEGTRNRAQKSGRNFGGVPLDNHGGRGGRGGRIDYGNGGRGGGRHDNGYGRGSQMGYGHGGQSQGYGQGPPPPFDPAAFGNLPPHLMQQAAQHGFLPPPPPGWQPGQRPPMPPMPPQADGYGGGFGGGNNGHGGYGGSNGYSRGGGRGGGYQRY